MTHGRQVLLLLLILILTFSAVDSWWRRRRRRRQTPVDCVVSSWSSWGSCTPSCSVGQQSRSRDIQTNSQYGGSGCPSLLEYRQCGESNGGCKHYCSNGVCSCRSGFYLSGKSCYDTNECASNGGRGPCDQICVNHYGSYDCQCRQGYSLNWNRRSCRPLDCGATRLNNCPSDTYRDSFMDVCKKATSVCPSGTHFSKQCTLDCPKDYRLAKIVRKAGQPFAKDYSEADFFSIHSTITCSIAGQGVQWNYASEITSYYCRRTNDPPTTLFISGYSILEHSPRGTLIGNLYASDPQAGQTFTYSVQSYGSLLFFRIQGNRLVNEWIPILNGPITLNNDSVNVTIRASDSGTPSMWIDKAFTIFVENVNDPPHSLGLSGNVVNESASIGEVVGQLTAVDGDDPFGTLPHSNNFLWTLVDSDNNFFRLDGVDIVVNRVLNHESKNNHLITIKCTDFGSPPKSATKRLVINVLNTNDKPLSVSISHSSVNENSAIGTLVGKFVASDEDKDPLDFYIGYSDSATLQKFKLAQNPSCQVNGQTYTCSQELIVKGHLDYESQSAYAIVVTVKDSISSFTRTFNISIVNVNERPTELLFHGSLGINENTAVGSIIGLFWVTDPDNKNYLQQTHTCQIVPSGDSSYFNVLQKVQLEVQRSIYHETTPVLNISVKCVDSGNPPLDILKDFSFTVTECRIGQVGDRNTECLQRNECLSNPCMNHGTCIDGIANYKCKCVSGFTGKRCENKIVYCKDQPCKNKGVCEEQDKKFVCRCSVGFLGRTCDRQPSLCSECRDKEETMCVTFQDTRIRCLGSAYQIPIVNNQGELSTDQLYDIESEIASLLDANFDSLKSRRRRSASRFYVERLQKTGKTDSQALLVFAALDIANMYKPVKASDACKPLANTKYRCPSNSECKAFANKGSSCPRGYKSVAESHQPPQVNGSGMSPGGIAGIVIGVLVFIVFLVLAVLWYKRNNKRQKNNNGGNRAPNDGAGQGERNFSNPIYDENIDSVNGTSNLYTTISSKSGTSNV